MVNPERLTSFTFNRLLNKIISASGSMTHFLPYAVRTRNLRIILISVALIVGFLFMVWARVFYGSMQAFGEGETHLQKTQYIKAITFFDRSIHWYTPFNPYVYKSARHLWEISMDAQARGDIRLALIAVRTIRRGFVSARSFYLPGKDWIEKCDQRIYELLKIDQVKKGSSNDKSLLKGSILDDPQVRGPDIFWSVILLIGFLGWVGSVMALIMRGFRGFGGNRILNASNFKWIGLWAVCFAAWIVGMVMA
jgi:hypothetical protein